MRLEKLVSIVAGATASLFLWAGCEECESPFDCARGEVCRDGFCEAVGSSLDGGLFIDTDSGISTDGDVDTDTDEDTDQDTDVSVQWIRIEGGSFQMGTTEDINAYAWPIHEVNVPSFEMAKTTTTAGQYKACYDEGACTKPFGVWSSEITQYTWGRIGGTSAPINGIVYSQAEVFCSWVGGRVPTEAEWEFAARSRGKDILYPWGNETPDCEYTVMWDSERGTTCSDVNPMPVCSMSEDVTEQGLCDMAGNVYEYVQDNFHSNYQGAPNDGSAWLEDQDSGRMLRGGSYLGSTQNMYGAVFSTTHRMIPPIGAIPEYPDLGFRCARDVADTGPDAGMDKGI